jgi:hypothetical protein
MIRKDLLGDAIADWSFSSIMGSALSQVINKSYRKYSKLSG